MGTEVPERHDLTLFPTVNDLKNQIHQALVDVENGTLAVTTPQVGLQVYALPDTVKGYNFTELKFRDFYHSVFHDVLNFADKPLLMYKLIPPNTFNSTLRWFYFRDCKHNHEYSGGKPKRIFLPLQY